MFCPKCGWQNPDNAKTCAACGITFPVITNTMSFSDMNHYENPFPEDTKTVALTPEQADANQNMYEQAVNQQSMTPFAGQSIPQQPGIPFAGPGSYSQATTPFGGPAPYQGTYAQPPRNNYQIGSIFNSDHSPYTFQNPHIGLLTAIIILGFLIAIFANCGLFRFNPDFYNVDESLQYFPLFPMWLLAAGFFVAYSDPSTRQDLLGANDALNMPFTQMVGILLGLLAFMALLIFIYSCIMAGQASLKRRTARHQLIGMNIFLTVNWIFWFFYTFSVLIADIMVWQEAGEWMYLLQLSVFAWLHTICLILVTILRLIYGKKITAAYNAHLANQAQMRYTNGMYAP